MSTTVVTLPQGNAPIGWVTIQNQRIPVILDHEWMRTFSALLKRTGGTTTDTSNVDGTFTATTFIGAGTGLTGTAASLEVGNATNADLATTATTAKNLLVDADSVSGYTAGSGGAITQSPNKTTGVTLDKPTGQITMSAAALAGGAGVIFTLTNSKIAATDIVTAKHSSSGTANAYQVDTLSHANGSVGIRVTNITAGSLSEAIVLNFQVWKGSAS